MKLRKIVIPFVALALLSGCKTDNGEHSAMPKVKVVIGATNSQTMTRTAFDEQNLAVQWTKGDKISLFADNITSPDTPVRTLNGATFFLWRYTTSTTDRAYFTGTVDPLSEGSYRYYAVSPLPKSVEGNIAKYEIPAIQSGKYDSAYDVMVAEPTQGAAIDGSLDVQRFTLNFKHKIHLFKITIPQGKNLSGESVRALRITFPTMVTGTMGVDLTNPNAAVTMSGGGNSIMLNFATPIGEGDTVWAMVPPVDVSTGPISFFAYTATAETQEVSTTMNKTLTAGKATPIKLTIAQLFNYHVNFTLGSNYLGESVSNVILTPVGDAAAQELVVPFNGQNVATYLYHKRDFQTALSGKRYSVKFESPSAIVGGGEISLPQMTGEGGATSFLGDVPYLLAQDFTGIADFNYEADKGTGNPSGAVLTNYGLTGYTGVRVKLVSGVMNIVLRHEAAAVYNARFETSAMGIKAGKTVKLKVAYDISKNNKWSYVDIGRVEGSGAPSGTDGVSESTRVNIGDNTVTRVESTVANCTNQSRISWFYSRTYNIGGNGFASWHATATLDNIKISITQ